VSLESAPAGYAAVLSTDTVKVARASAPAPITVTLSPVAPTPATPPPAFREIKGRILIEGKPASQVAGLRFSSVSSPGAAVMVDTSQVETNFKVLLADGEYKVEPVLSGDIAIKTATYGQTNLLSGTLSVREGSLAEIRVVLGK
jgi:hypothetical protein